MPFNKDAFFQLLQRESLTQRGLELEFKKFIESLEGDKNVTLSQAYISDLLTGGREEPPPSLIDALYSFAYDRNHRDLNFYTPPVLED